MAITSKSFWASAPNGQGGHVPFIIENVPVTFKRTRPWTRKICFATGEPIKAFEAAYKRTLHIFHKNKFIKQVDWVSEKGYTYLVLQGREEEELWTVTLEQGKLD